MIIMRQRYYSSNRQANANIYPMIENIFSFRTSPLHIHIRMKHQTRPAGLRYYPFKVFRIEILSFQNLQD